MGFADEDYRSILTIFLFCALCAGSTASVSAVQPVNLLKFSGPRGLDDSEDPVLTVELTSVSKFLLMFLQFFASDWPSMSLVAYLLPIVYVHLCCCLSFQYESIK